MKRKKLGLSLGAGSSRGFAHVGVLQVLQENNIEIDYISGCSMGAFIGAIYAAGTDLGMVEKLSVELKSDDFVDFTLPRSGLVKGEHIVELIATLTKNMNFEDLKTPFRCVACDIREGKTVEFYKGNVAKAVRASISIPGIFVPYEIDGVLYVDGGVLENTPIQTVKDMGADVVVAVHVGSRGEPADISGGVKDIIMRTFDLMSYEATRLKLKEADILIQPEVRHIYPYNNHKADEAIQIGRESAEAVLLDIIKALENA